MSDYERPDYALLERDVSALIAHAEELSDGQLVDALKGDDLAMDIANTFALLMDRIEKQQAELKLWHPGYADHSGSGSTAIKHPTPEQHSAFGRMLANANPTATIIDPWTGEQAVPDGSEEDR